MVFGRFYGLLVAEFVSWFVFISGMSKKIVFRGFLDEENNLYC